MLINRLAVVVAIAFAALAAAFVIAPGANARDVALLIGNARYSHDQNLDNPVRDIEAMARRLRTLGYDDVITRTNLTLDQFVDALDDFEDTARGADRALIYYAGHGMEIGGVNYLIPVDARLQRESRAPYEAVTLDVVRDRLRGTRRLRVVVIDACRNNRFLGASRGERGMRRPEDRAGEIVLFSTTPGATAEDDVPGRTANSPFAVALGEALDRTPDQDVRILFTSLRHRVSELAGRDQTPVAVIGQMPPGQVTLAAMATTPAPVEPPGAQPPPVDEDLAAWEAASADGSRAALQGYLDTFPEGRFRASAQRLLASLAAPSTGETGATTAPSPVAGGSSSAARAPGAVFRDTLSSGGEGPEMVVVPAGSFTMGSPASEAGRNSLEGPQHTVTIPRAFAVGRYEVTFDDWDACVRGGGCTNPSDGGWGRGRRPVINVDWNHAQAYARWLNGQVDGSPYRLLSEAEWEYAARAGTRTAYPWGGAASHERANYGSVSCCSGLAAGSDRWVNTAPVGSFPANAFGLHDMHGNVWEWVEDCWANSYSGAPINGSARTSGDCSRRVLRGGSWESGPLGPRSAGRYRYRPSDRSGIVGFRLARTLD